MGEVINIRAELLKDNADNPAATQTMVALVADALGIYAEAAENVKRNGAIVSHPRTGSPIENPYLKVMNTQARFLQGLQNVAMDRVFSLVGKNAQTSETHGPVEI
jgi:phage terminase small subunit